MRSLSCVRLIAIPWTAATRLLHPWIFQARVLEWVPLPSPRRAWKIHGWRSLVAPVHGIAKSRTQLSDLTFTFYFHALEKEMATHSSVLAWRIPGTEEPNGLLSMGLHRVGHDRSDLAAAAAKQDKFALQVQNDKKALN